MEVYRYAVVILNYNTLDDSIIAAKSVISNAKFDDFVICIADNYSSKVEDRNKLGEIRLKNTITIQLAENFGYARGNVEAIRYLRNIFEIEYIVIMNPDVEIVEKHTIDILINEIEDRGNTVVGAQPLVNTLMWNQTPENQINIRRVPENTFDVLIYSTMIFRRLFNKRAMYLNYVLQRPYKDPIEFEVPSGAFFVINNKIFADVGDFDICTFLYCEEPILGYKLKRKNLSFILIPKLIVNHHHGKSTGSHGNNISKFSVQCQKNSWSIYMRKYLNKPFYEIEFVKFCVDFDRILKNSIDYFRKMF